MAKRMPFLLEKLAKAQAQTKKTLLQELSALPNRIGARITDLSGPSVSSGLNRVTAELGLSPKSTDTLVGSAVLGGGGYAAAKRLGLLSKLKAMRG